MQQLAASKLEGDSGGGGGGSGGNRTFVFVVNLQLPRSFTKKDWAASVVLYWGVPVEFLSGEQKKKHKVACFDDI